MLDALEITKTFGSFRALDALSMHVDRGTVYGLVGPNGAGKSTLIRCLTGVYQPDSGAALLEGQRIFENPAAKTGSAMCRTMYSTFPPPPWRT